MIRGGCSRVVGLRYSNVFGPGESHKGEMASMIYQIAQQIKEGHNPRIFQQGEQKRDFVYIEDVVEANLLAAQARGSYIVNCGSGAANTFNEMVSQVQRVLGTDRAIDYIPTNPHSSRFQMHTECDMSCAERTIGFKPRYTLEQGVSRYYASGTLTTA
jgi:ADP-L-glycero-D-manno-heptose 6-epimerase